MEVFGGSVPGASAGLLRVFRLGQVAMNEEGSRFRQIFDGKVASGLGANEAAAAALAEFQKEPVVLAGDAMDAEMTPDADMSPEKPQKNENAMEVTFFLPFPYLVVGGRGEAGRGGFGGQVHHRES